MILRVAFLLAFGATVLPPSLLPAATMETVAGTGQAGFSGDGGPAGEALLDQPFGVVVGPGGDIWFCDTNNHVIRRIARDTGIIETVIGCGQKGLAGDGEVALRAELNEPYEVRLHPNGDVYWVERLNHCVRRLDRGTGRVHRVAGTGQRGFSGDTGPAVAATLNEPHSIQFDRDARFLYICDIRNHRIRRVEVATGIIDTWCGTGAPGETADGAPVGKQTPLNGPRALDRAPDGDLWLALREGNAVYRIDMAGGTLHHVAGTGRAGFTGNGGPARFATIAGPKGIAVSPDGKRVYLADTETHTVRAIDLRQKPPVLDVLVGDGTRGDGAADNTDPLRCRLARLHGLGVDPETGDLYIGDSENHKLRVVRGLDAGISR
jgi:sugar lactone lactonase YvrE